MEGAVMDRLLNGVILGGLIIAVFLAVWNLGYAQAQRDLASQVDYGIEGYCLADEPQHPGPCR